MSQRTGLVIGVLGIVLAVPGTLVALNELGTIDLFPKFFAPGAEGDCATTAPAGVTLSTGSAPRGAEVTVYGTCFRPGELVDLRVHATPVGSATADTNGDFTQTITIPESAPPPDFPTSITATGRSSIKSASAPFSTVES